MKVKKKPCRGTGKAKGHGCNNLAYRVRYGLCKQCYRNWLLNTPEGQKTIAKSKISAAKRVETEQKRQLRKEKEKHKSIAKLIQEARVPFQQWIRRRDVNRKCISCGKDSETWDAGHYYKAELYSGLIFDADNVNKQCKYCNKYLDGNESGYRLGLIERYGREFVEALDKRAIEQKQYKYTREELIEIKNKYKLKLKNE